MDDSKMSLVAKGSSKFMVITPRLPKVRAVFTTPLKVDMPILTC